MPKVVFQFELKQFKAYIGQGKKLRICGSFKSAKNRSANTQIENRKMYGPQIANPQMATFAEGSQI